MDINFFIDFLLSFENFLFTVYRDLMPFWTTIYRYIEAPCMLFQHIQSISLNHTPAVKMKAPESTSWYEETNVLYNLTEYTVNHCLYRKKYCFKETKKMLKSYLTLKCKIIFHMNTYAISIIKLQKSKNLENLIKIQFFTFYYKFYRIFIESWLYEKVSYFLIFI